MSHQQKPRPNGCSFPRHFLFFCRNKLFALKVDRNQYTRQQLRFLFCRGRQYQFFTRVCTYVQRGSKYCFVVVLVVVLLFLVTLVRILHFRPISPCFQLLPGSLAQEPSLAALPCSLARQPCPAALPGSQPCRKVCKLFYGRRPACMQYCILLLGRQFSSSFPRN
jgi:hypothetical protein